MTREEAFGVLVLVACVIVAYLLQLTLRGWKRVLQEERFFEYMRSARFRISPALRNAAVRRAQEAPMTAPTHIGAVPEGEG